MEFLIKFAQAHETFRVPEIEALALIEGLEMEIVDYSQDVRRPTQYMLVRDLLDTVPLLCRTTGFSRSRSASGQEIHPHPVYT
jgi:tRNA G10  N-methylase Trm11